MGRPSKLTEGQRAEIAQRLAGGETVRALAKEYGVAPSRISEHCSETSNVIKTATNKLVDAEVAVRSLSITEQISVRSLADRLLSISFNLAGAAESGAKTANKLASVAHSQAEKITGTDLVGDAMALKSVLMLQQGANEAAKTGLGLLTANKDMMKDSGDEPGVIKVVAVNMPNV